MKIIPSINQLVNSSISLLSVLISISGLVINYNNPKNMNNSLSYETQLTVRLVNGMNKLLSLLQSRSIGAIHSDKE